MFEEIKLKQELINGSLYLSYLALESTLSRVDLFIERLPQFDEPIKTELYGRCLVEYRKIAHPLVAKVKKSIWPIKRPLATAVKGENLQNEMLPRLRIPHRLERKAKLAIFSREEGVLKIDLLAKGLTRGIGGDRGSP